MHRCSGCNHIFVQGTQRFEQHAVIGCQPVKLSSPTTKPTNARKRALEPLVSSASPSPSKHCVCGVCHASVKSITSYFLHWLEQHQRDGQIGESDVLQEVWQCRSCPSNITRLFPDWKLLLPHQQQAHQDEEVGQFETYTLNTCDLSFPDQESCSLHYSTCHHLSFVGCSACGKKPVNLCAHYAKVHLELCKICGVSVEDVKTHYVTKHKCQQLWNRQNKLEIITSDSSRILSGSQKPARLANGAIAKHLPDQQPQQETLKEDSVRVLQNDALKEKFAPVNDGFQCVKCRTVFVNEKLMEKHYFANHEFRCKFCEQVMDKDIYGAHLRHHLASERRKAATATNSQ